MEPALPWRRIFWPSSGVTARDQEGVADALAAVLAQVSGEHSVAHTRLSIRRMQHIFKTKLNDSPMSYYLKLRPQAAGKLLFHGDLPVHDVPDACGFSSPPVVARSRFDRTPKEFRRGFGAERRKSLRPEVSEAPRRTALKPRFQKLGDCAYGSQREKRAMASVTMESVRKRFGPVEVFHGVDVTVADGIVVMNDGRVEQIGGPMDLHDSPANLFVAGFIGSEARVLARMAGSLPTAIVPGRQLPRIGETLFFNASAEHVHIFDAASGARL